MVGDIILVTFLLSLSIRMCVIVWRISELFSSMRDLFEVKAARRAGTIEAAPAAAASDSPIRLHELDQVATRILVQLLPLPSAEKNAKLNALYSENPTLHALVINKFTELANGEGEKLHWFLRLVDWIVPDRFAVGHECDVCMGGKISLLLTLLSVLPWLLLLGAWAYLPLVLVIWPAAYYLAVLYGQATEMPKAR